MWGTGSLHRCVSDSRSLCCIVPGDTCNQHRLWDCPLLAGEPCDQDWHHYAITFLHCTDHYDLKNARVGDTVIFNFRPCGWKDYRLIGGRTIVGNWAMHCVLMTGKLGKWYEHDRSPRMCVFPDQVGGRKRKFSAYDIECTLKPAFMQDCHEHMVPPDFMDRAVAYSTVWNADVLFVSRFRFLDDIERSVGSPCNWCNKANPCVSTPTQRKNGDADEWEIPFRPGSDVRMLIVSPTEPEVSEVPAGFMTA
jgi:hypothetical protein